MARNTTSSVPFLGSHAQGSLILCGVVLLAICSTSVVTAEGQVPEVLEVTGRDGRQGRFMDLFFDGMKYAGDILEKNKAAAAAKADSPETKQLEITISRLDDDGASKAGNTALGGPQAHPNASTTTAEPPIRPFDVGFAMNGKDMAAANKINGQPAASKQIFPFNPYVAYGPFISIPLWILVGLYSKLLAKTKEFYSTGYRVDFWKKKPYGLKGYYLHPAYYPVEKVSTTTAAPEAKHEEHHEASHDPWWDEEQTGWGDDFNPTHDGSPLYADEDTSLPPLPDDEEYLQDVAGKGNDKAKVRRMGLAPVAVNNGRKNKRRNWNKSKLLARRAGQPAIGQPMGGGRVPDGKRNNLPWGAERRNSYTQVTRPPLPIQRDSNAAEAHGSQIMPTTWRPPVSIIRQALHEGSPSQSASRTTRYNHGA